ncbi:hypothetical protein ACTTAI_00055 (plasmid) [Rhodobacter capsulatus]|uniref:hypothetical protein n=1 Tax=Rhodobacter capsulatus TaxID=1061 RepID=UPI004029B464
MDFESHDVTAVDLTEILDLGTERSAILGYLFRRIEMLIEEKRPTLILIDGGLEGARRRLLLAQARRMARHRAQEECRRGDDDAVSSQIRGSKALDLRPCLTSFSFRTAKPRRPTMTASASLMAS